MGQPWKTQRALEEKRTFNTELRGRKGRSGEQKIGHSSGDGVEK